MKPKVAFYWCASCGGCEEAVIDLGEDILTVADAVDIVFWPVALDFKREDLDALADGELAAAFINGAIRTSEQEEMAELLRRKAAAVVAFGSCACQGGIPGLANLYSREEILERVYHEAPSLANGEGTMPSPETDIDEGHLSLPEFFGDVRTLGQVIEVDYFLPGCAPPPNLIRAAVMALLEGTLPRKGSVLAPDLALCSECTHVAGKPQAPQIRAFKRPHEIVPDPDVCLLAQGLICLGPATRAGCGAACIRANMPCTGCMGPTSRVIDHGAKALSAVASLIDSTGEAEMACRAAEIPDPVGTFYRYGLPASLLHRRVANPADGGSER